MKKWMGLFVLIVSSLVGTEIAPPCPHDQIKQYSMHGNFQKGLATKSMGAKEFEVWRASIAVGSKTPKHVHETEEVFIVLKGEILAIVGDQEFRCKAPATLICPANVPHQLINVGDEPTDQILVLGIDSQISDIATGKVMELPWR
ncbi:MAG TPA: cupin domain-containing protein [Rhabdochlamydiaceae bacterium]|nr:cupin domain-containing protein [Rhabdochlamydiaceae bacterium]